MEDLTRHYKVITVGESTIDAFMRLAHANSDAHLDKASGGLCFRFGEKIDVERYDFTIGGNATNVAVGLSRLGIKSTLCTEIGDDEFSLKIRNMLANEHVERVLVHQVSGPSNFSVIINFKGDRTLFVEDVTRQHEFNFQDVTAELVYITSLGNVWQKPYRTALEFAHKCKAKIAFNPGSRQLHEGKDLVQEVVRQSQMLFLNKEEAELLVFDKETQEHELSYVKELLTKIKALGAKIVVITDGKKGSYALDTKGNFYHQSMFDCEVVERTGAGDAYTVGFIAATFEKQSVPQAMEWGSWNAASVVSKIGAQAGLLTKEQMEEKTR
jgi:ribokinase